MALGDIFTLVLRSIGVWALIQALSRALSSAMVIYGVLSHRFVTSGSEPISWWNTILGYGLPVLVEVGLAVYLVAGSARISRWFYRSPDRAESVKSVNIDSAAAYQLGARLLGIYAILWSIKPVSRAGTSLIDHRGPVSLSAGEGESFLQSLLYLGFALALIVGSRRIGEWFARIRPTDA